MIDVGLEPVVVLSTAVVGSTKSIMGYLKGVNSVCALQHLFF